MPTKLNVYINSIILVGFTLLVISLLTTDYSRIEVILALGILAGVLEYFLIELPNGTLFTSSQTFTFIALLFYGVENAVVVELVIFLLTTALLWKKRNIKKNLFNLSLYIICIIVAGLFFEWLYDRESIFHWKTMLLLFAVIGIHSLVNYILIAVVFSTLNNKPYWGTLLNILLDAIYMFLTTSSITLFLVYIYSLKQPLLFFIVTFFVVFCYFLLRYAFGLFINLRKIFLSTMEKFSEVSEMKLLINRGHSTRVGKMARRIAEELKLPMEEIDSIHYAALFHDMGKLQLGEKLFIKRGPLTIEEEREYRNHIELGSKMVKEISGLDKAAEYVFYHHEQWDGNGFPYNLAEESIPLGSRIISVANELDHLLLDPKIKNPKKEFSKLAGNKLDPKLVEVSLNIFMELCLGESVEEVVHEKESVEKKVDSKLSHKLKDSELLSKLSVTHLTFKHQVFIDGKGQEVSLDIEQKLTVLIEKVQVEQRIIREIVENEAGRLYDVYCTQVPDGYQFLLTDITPIFEFEKQKNEQVQTLYRDVIFSVTKGKMELIDMKELNNIVQKQSIGSLPIEKKGDVPLSRQLVQEILTQLNVPSKVAFQILLCTSEVVTNVIKHATSGSIHLFYENGTLKIVVQDKGSGIDLSELPKSTLLAGYSTKVSLGQGFNLLMKMMDKVKLYTSPKGTTVVMEMNLVEMVGTGHFSEKKIVSE
ncbi:HD domain-containing phosphohydrolase [Bacillus salitolerans]|uniref:HD domain-containing phosphohydrolase n=1 Tax=Bacillus salitolerans TaxID=1437434 RepID=A0ABW4LS56_9BACI